MPADVRMLTYEALIDKRSLGEGDSDRDLWGPRTETVPDRVILLGLDIKMFYGGPKEAVMHGIYRQNYGFTDIVIGRKHADAPYHRRLAHLGRFRCSRNLRPARRRSADQALEGGLRRLLRFGRPGRPDGKAPRREAGVHLGQGCAQDALGGENRRPADHAREHVEDPGRRNVGDEVKRWRDVVAVRPDGR